MEIALERRISGENISDSASSSYWSLKFNDDGMKRMDDDQADADLIEILTPAYREN